MSHCLACSAATCNVCYFLGDREAALTDSEEESVSASRQPSSARWRIGRIADSLGGGMDSLEDLYRVVDKEEFATTTEVDTFLDQLGRENGSGHTWYLAGPKYKRFW